MKKFVFSLEKVLNVKNQIYDVKKSELLQLQLKLKEIDDEIEANHEKFIKYNNEVNSAMKNGTTSSHIEAYKNYFKALDDEEDHLKMKRVSCQKEIDDKQKEIAAVKTEISGLEKLKQKQLVEYNKMLQKQQEREIEEFLNEKISNTQ